MLRHLLGYDFVAYFAAPEHSCSADFGTLNSSDFASCLLGALTRFTRFQCFTNVQRREFNRFSLLLADFHAILPAFNNFKIETIFFFHLFPDFFFFSWEPQGLWYGNGSVLVSAGNHHQRRCYSGSWDI